MDNNSYIHIGGWMVNDLHLHGADLMVNAIIYGFSQDGCSEFRGSLNYLTEWLDGIISRRQVINTLNSLVKRGLIISTKQPGNLPNTYKCVPKDKIIQGSAKIALPLTQHTTGQGSAKSALPKVVQKLHQGSAKSALQIIYNNISSSSSNARVCACEDETHKSNIHDDIKKGKKYEKEFLAQLRADDEWLTAMKRSFSLDDTALFEWLESFAIQNVCCDEQHIDISSIKRHFHGWLKKQLNAPKLTHNANNKSKIQNRSRRPEKTVAGWEKYEGSF